MTGMVVTFLDLKAQYETLKEEINRKVLEVVSSQNFVLGSEVENLEREVASYCGARYALGVSSGSDALIISLMAFEIGEGDCIITTPFTFFATAGSAARLKARPVFCDVEEESLNINPEKIRELVENRLKKSGKRMIRAVIPVHLYGQCADMDPIMDLAKEYNLLVIEDAAQAIGAEYRSRRGVMKAGVMGDTGILSFYPSKNLGGFGDGGMVLTNDESTAERMKRLRVHGERDRYYYEEIGGNFRLDALQAAVLRVKLKHLENWQIRRREKAGSYDRKFQDSGLVEQGLVRPPLALHKDTGIRNCHTYHQYIIRVEQRDRLQEYLKGKKVGSAVYYPLPLHLQKCFSYLGYKKGDFPVSEKAAAEVLALPIYPELTEEQQDYVVSAIHEFYRLHFKG